MHRFGNNIVNLDRVGHVTNVYEGGTYDFYSKKGKFLFSVELTSDEFEIVVAELGVPEDSQFPRTGVFSREAVDNDKPTGVFSLQAAA